MNQENEFHESNFDNFLLDSYCLTCIPKQDVMLNKYLNGKKLFIKGPETERLPTVFFQKM